MTPSIVFHVHLVQDVATLQPLLRLSRALPGRTVEVIMSSDLNRLDVAGRWSSELERLCAELDIGLTTYGSELEAHRQLQRKHGILVAGSESTVPAHTVAHNLFRSASSSFTKVTLQHGFECVGFLHNAAHNATAGRDVRFAADIIVGWFAPEVLTAVVASERPKLYVAGPPALIEGSATRRYALGEGRGLQPSDYEGIVCENLHSVRFRMGTLRATFRDEFEAFAARLRGLGAHVHLRSHPAGRTMEKADLDPEVIRSTEPLYRMDLTSFAYAISAPSSILFDFILAGVPVAVWSDLGTEMDSRNFDGLAKVATAEDWWRFVLDVAGEPASYVASQDRFVDALRIPVAVRDRYAHLLCSA